MNNEHQTVGESFTTEQSSITILRSLLPATWIIRSHIPDFHNDYLVEVTTSGELTGKHFGIQLKGWKPRRKNAMPSYSLKTKHLLYFTEKSPFPVFLVLIDVSAHVGYWVFTQPLGDKIGIDRLKKQKSVTINFPPEQTLADCATFESAIGDAIIYMRNKHPGSVAAAIRSRKKELETKDERVSVEITATETTQHVTINPKQKIEFSFSINQSEPGTATKVQDFVEKGADLLLKASQLEVKGMPILEELLKEQGEITMQFASVLDGHAILTWGTGGHLQLPAKYRMGIKYFMFECEIPNSPLKLAGSLERACLSQGGDCSVSLDLAWEKWKGINIGVLPYFENLHELFRAAHANSKIDLTLHIQGNRFLKVGPGELLQRHSTPVLLLLDSIAKARQIAQKLQIAVRLPDFSKPGTAELLDGIDELFTLTFEGIHTSRIAGSKLTFSLKPTQPAKLSPSDGTLMIVHPQQYNLWGTCIDFGTVQEQFTNMRLIGQKAKPGGRVEFTFEPMDNSLRILRKGGEIPIAPPSNASPVH
jgi:hypothetical protein